MTSLAETRQLLGAWLTAVADVVRGVNAAEPLEVLLSRIAKQACRLVGFDFCAVMLVDPSGDWLQTRGSQGLSAEQLLRRDLRTTATRMELQLAFTVRDVQRARTA